LEEVEIREALIKMFRMETGPADMDGIRVVTVRALMLYLVIIILKLRVH